MHACAHAQPPPAATTLVGGCGGTCMLPLLPASSPPTIGCTAQWCLPALCTSTTVPVHQRQHTHTHTHAGGGGEVPQPPQHRGLEAPSRRSTAQQGQAAAERSTHSSRAGPPRHGTSHCITGTTPHKHSTQGLAAGLRPGPAAATPHADMLAALAYIAETGDHCYICMLHAPQPAARQNLNPHWCHGPQRRLQPSYASYGTCGTDGTAA
jgi:hypothetical protein